ncbi:MAG: hypothetical protein WCL04_01705 [Verrucomicrobiota bacterium]
MKLTGKDLIAIGKKQPVGFVCGLLSLMLALVWYFRSDVVDEQTKLRDEKQSEAKRLKANNAKGHDLEKDLEALVAANKEAQDRAVQPKDNTLNLKYFYTMEREAGVKDINTRGVGLVLPSAAKGTPPKTAYVPDAYSIIVSGDFRQTVDLIRRIERGPRFSRFTNVVLANVAQSVEAAAEAGPKLNLTVNVELLANPPPTLGAPTAK